LLIALKNNSLSPTVESAPPDCAFSRFDFEFGHAIVSGRVERVQENLDESEIL
jgi:hypothetical protein